VTGYPDAWFDGVLNCHGAYTNDDQMYAWYLSKINQRLGVPSQVNMEVETEQVAPQTYEVTATLSLDPGAEPLDVLVHMVQILDYYPEYYDNRYRNCVMQAADRATAHLTPDEPKTITRQFVIDGVSWDNRENVSIVCWARETGYPGPKEVFQSGERVWPLVPICPGDVDGDNDTDLSDLGALLAAYGTSPGDPRWNPNADFDGDDIVGLSDLAHLLADYGCGT